MDDDKLLKAIQRFPSERCASDPMPTWFLKKSPGMILICKKCGQSVFF